jgi:hypothetical protein
MFLITLILSICGPIQPSSFRSRMWTVGSQRVLGGNNAFARLANKRVSMHILLVEIK